MKGYKVLGVVVAGFMGGCAVSPETIECLQPDRRVQIEVNGFRMLPPKPPAKPEAKPDAKPEAKPEAAPPAPKPERQNFELSGLAQGNSAFDHMKSELKQGGKGEIDDFWVKEVQGKFKPTVNAVIITGHSDRTEGSGTDLSEARAKSVRDYLVSKGVDQKVMFWEGRGSRQPVPVTKFCPGS